MRLIDAFSKLATTHYFQSGPPLWDPVEEPLQVVVLRPKSALHILHRILDVMLKIKDHPAKLSKKDIADILLTIGGELSWLGLESEATASDLLAVQVFRHLASRETFAGCLPRLAFALGHLSSRYQYQLRHESAVQASEQSVYWSRVSCEREPDIGNRVLLLTSLNAHSISLRAAGRVDAAISVAHEALVVCRTLLPETFQAASTQPDWALLHPEDEFQASECSRSFFRLGNALSDASRHREAYLVLKEGLEIVTGFKGAIPPPYGSDTDAFFNHMCKMAEAGEFEPDFLAEAVILYGNLSRIYPQKFSNEFLNVLYARAYFSEHDTFAIRNLRLFLEPSWDSPPPIMDDFSTSTPWIDDWVVENAVHAFYASQTDPEFDAIESFISHLIQTHFDIAIRILRKQVASLVVEPVIDWSACYSTVNNTLLIFTELSRPERFLVLEALADVAVHSRKSIELPRSLSAPMNWDCNHLLWTYCWMLWGMTSSSDALAITEEMVHYNHAFRTPEEAEWLGLQAFLLADRGHFADAEAVLHDATMAMNGPDPNWLLIDVESWILRHTGRTELVLLLLEKSTSSMKSASDSTPSDSFVCFLLTDLSSAQLEAGQTKRALETAEGAVAKCWELHLTRPDSLGPRLATAHALISLSNCLAACGRADEGLRAAQEAAETYAGSSWRAHCPWGYRSQEFSSEAFHTLSLRLAASGQPDEALVNAEKAVEEYRELVSLAIRHAPSLANGLRHLASRFWNVGRFDESIVALKEAIGFLRGVADQQPHHIPTLGDALEQLAEYLSLQLQGDVEGSSTVASECALIRERLAHYPVSTEEDAEAESDSEFWDAEEGSGPHCEQTVPQGAALVAAQMEGDEEFQQDGISPFQGEAIPPSPLQAPVVTTSGSTSEPKTSPIAQSLAAVPENEPLATEKARDVDVTPRFEVKIELKSPPIDVVGWILIGISSLAWAGLVLALARK
ncbi:hypothetical protein C8J57DRAFT_159135 [Mycena rebaudengoi]|nr:hypothetical protein C8J57DRAFT_159135 [Mycena rebaudengoi]